MTDGHDTNTHSDSFSESAQSAFPPVPEGFTICDQASANWIVRKIVAARSYAQHVRAWAEVEIRRAEGEERFFEQRFGSQLEAWAREYLQSTGGRRRSISLPAANIGFRAAAPRLVVVDDGILLNWCRANFGRAITVDLKATGNDALRLMEWRSKHCPSAIAVEHVMKSIVDEHFHSTGECPEGTQCVIAEKFYIK